MNKINKSDAYKIINNYLIELEKEVEEALKLYENETIETDFCWVFFYNSKEYVETESFESLLVGTCPLIVDKNSGEVHETGTARSAEFYVSEYEKK